MKNTITMVEDNNDEIEIALLGFAFNAFLGAKEELDTLGPELQEKEAFCILGKHLREVANAIESSETVVVRKFNGTVYQ